MAIVNNAVVTKGVHGSFWISVLFSFEYIPRSGIAASHGSSVFLIFKIIFKFLIILKYFTQPLKKKSLLICDNIDGA